MAEILINRSEVLEGALQQEVSLLEVYRRFIMQATLVASRRGRAVLTEGIPMSLRPSEAECLSQILSLPFSMLQHEQWIGVVENVLGTAEELRRSLRVVLPSECAVRQVGEKSHINTSEKVRAIVTALNRGIAQQPELDMLSAAENLILQIRFIAQQAITQQLRDIHLPISSVIKEPFDDFDVRWNQVLRQIRDDMTLPLTKTIMLLHIM